MTSLPDFKTQMLIGGNWTDSHTRQSFPVENPAARGSSLAVVPRADGEDVARAVAAARAAFPAWRRTPPKTRAAMLRKAADEITRHRNELAIINTLETGSAIRLQSRSEVASLIDIFYYFSGLADEIRGTVPTTRDGLLHFTQYEPYGVVGAIVPWNDPLVLTAVKIAPALLAGNTIVLKSAEDAPLGILRLAAILNEIFPAGVVNILTGLGEECGAALVRADGIDKIAFTGSTEVGREIAGVAGQRLIPCTLELGGKSPQIVFPDADSMESARGVIQGMRLSRQGQSCSAGERLLVHESIADSIISKLVAELKSLRIGDPMDETSDIGAINNRRQYDKINGMVARTRAGTDSRVVFGAEPLIMDPYDRGYYINPGIIFNENADTEINTAEVFGPLLSVTTWKTYEEAIALANGSPYGLTGFIWTHKLEDALRCANDLDAGWVQVNNADGPHAGITFGGHKASGIGREFSKECLIGGYAQPKMITIKY